MTFAEWVTVGAAFGIKAFFAVLVFLLCCGVVLGLFGTLVTLIGGGNEDDMDRN